MVNSMLSYSGLSEGFWGEAMLMACYLLNRVPNKRNKVTPYELCIKEDPRMFDEAMQSRDVAFWKEAINDEMDSIMENNTWILSNLPLGCKPLGCKWIFKRKMKVDGTIDKCKARLVIQGFRQKEGIDYFDTNAPVAQISTIRLLIALAATYNLASKNMASKFDEVVLSSGFVLNQPDKCVYCKFDKSGNGVIICLYVDDMLIFGTDQDQVDKTKEFLSSNFSMMDIGEADMILGIKIKREDKGITITQSHYIEKIIKNLNVILLSIITPLDPTIKLIPNTGKVVDQLAYSRAIGCLMYAMKSARPDIAYVVGKLSRYNYTPYSITAAIMRTQPMEAEFVSFTALTKSRMVESLIYEFRYVQNQFSPISIHCDSAATLAKAYYQIYNGKSRHLSVKHSMVRELITNGVISVDFVRSQQNLADHLTRGLARDLVHKSAIGMGLKSIEISNDETPNSLLANVGS
ncbi:zinc finger, CCHC-type containing protein [Tanacetum coccineum]